VEDRSDLVLPHHRSFLLQDRLLGGDSKELHQGQRSVAKQEIPQMQDSPCQQQVCPRFHLAAQQDQPVCRYLTFRSPHQHLQRRWHSVKL
jgi:hypothetical protein